MKWSNIFFLVCFSFSYILQLSTIMKIVFFHVNVNVNDVVWVRIHQCHVVWVCIYGFCSVIICCRCVFFLWFYYLFQLKTPSADFDLIPYIYVFVYFQFVTNFLEAFFQCSVPYHQSHLIRCIHTVTHFKCHLLHHGSRKR